MSTSKNSSGNLDYKMQRQKNNEASKNSRMKKKEHEAEISKERKKLEITYVKLQKQINQMRSLRY